MPSNERVGLDDHQGFPPVEEFGQGDHGKASSRSGRMVKIFELAGE